MVLEVIDRSVDNVTTMYAIRAAIPPGPLSDEIKKVQKQWIAAGKRANAKELYGSIPVIYPKVHVVAGLPIRAIGRFPIRQAIKEEWPEIREENWYMMGLVISSTDKQNLVKVFYLCNKKLAIDPSVPMDYAAKHIRSPVQARWPDGDTRPVGPPQPPPPYPPPSQQLVYSADGLVAVEPDSVTTLGPGAVMEWNW